MKKKSLIAIALVALVAIVALLVHRSALAREAPEYRFAAIERGDVQATVSATGTLGAVRTVSVGTQVSGQVSEILADFNDHVKKGQLIARIDPTLALQAVTDAQASVERAEAQLLQAQRENARNRELATSGLVARSAVEMTESSFDVARANVKSARVALDRARQNLSYTNIYAPIDGVVVERNVDTGQTVAASLSAPQLFLIANDLAHMQILARVGESDIAAIKDGQSVKFSVQALPRQTFDGVVEQVRLQSATTDNVVNYTVVVAVENPKQALLPGMTARVDFLVKSAENVLKVPNAALRFKPTEEQIAKLRADAKPAAPRTSTSPTTSPTSARSTTRGARGTGRGEGSFGTLYFLDAKGELQMARVRTGIADKTSTEVTGRTIREGMKVIAGTGNATKTASTDANTPFQPTSTGNNRQRGGGGVGF